MVQIAQEHSSKPALRPRRLAERLFVQAGAPADRRPCDAEMAWSLRLLPPECPLFARKFPANTSSQACRP